MTLDRRSGDLPSARSRLAHVSLVVADYDEAIRFFIDALGFELVEDHPAVSDATG